MPRVPDYADQRPVHAQIAEDIRRRIASGSFPPGAKLPPIRELCAEYSVASETIRRALDILRDQHLVVTQSTRGTFVLSEPDGSEPSEYDAVMARVNELAEEIRQLRDRMDSFEGRAGEPSEIPEPRPVVAAIVTSARGVLIARRNDGSPPWTFIAGEIEPGESPADAAVREVKEETGLEVAAGGVIGRRVHPQTNRTMVYMAAAPVQGTDAFVADQEELAEVRWVSLAEADDLMGGAIFETVRDHLRRRLPSMPR